jgi:predicted DNA-binding transcriptional regulator AlpA
MDQSFPENFENIADEMGIALYQKFSLNEASLFLRCPASDIVNLVNDRQLNGIKISAKNVQFFGYQLLEYVLGQVTDYKPLANDNKPKIDRIIRAKEVQELTGLSRTTLWRFENKGEFPRRVSLGANTVGWKLSEVQNWIQERQ